MLWDTDTGEMKGHIECPRRCPFYRGNVTGKQTVGGHWDFGDRMGFYLTAPF